MNDYPQVVKDIHNEFNIAGERLLQESLALLDKAEKVDVDKAQRLNSVGFANVKEVKKALSIEAETRTPSEMAKIVMEYKKDYPLHKFISNNDIAKICKKYNLVHGNTEQFIGFVPAKNLQEIEAFKNNHNLQKKFRITDITIEALFSGSLNRALNPKCRAVTKFLKDNDYTLTVDSHEYEIYEAINHVARRVKGDSYFNLRNVKFIEVSNLEICAPKNDMIKKKVFDLSFPKFELTIEQAPDPVVLYPVKHGAIIVTAWGDEASDPLVVNEQMN